MIPPIFVISLARATERRADITRRLDAEGLQYEIVDAVDGRELNRADYADRLEQYDSKEGSSLSVARIIEIGMIVTALNGGRNRLLFVAL